MIAEKHSFRKGFQVIKDRLTYGRKALVRTRKRERTHGRDIIWPLLSMPAPELVEENWPGSASVIAVRSKGQPNGKFTDDPRWYFVKSLCTSAKALPSMCVIAGALRTPGIGLATPDRENTLTATARSMTFRSWPRSGAWP